VYEALNDARFPHVETATEYPVSSPVRGLGLVPLVRAWPGLDLDDDMPRLLDLLNKAKRYAAAFLEKRDAQVLSMLASLVGSGARGIALLDTPKWATIVLDIVPCAATPGEEDIVFRKQVYGKGHVWSVRLRVGPEKGKKSTLTDGNVDVAESNKKKGKEKGKENGQKRGWSDDSAEMAESSKEKKQGKKQKKGDEQEKE
jgi:hypothetical protein